MEVFSILCKICEHEKPVKKFADVHRKICKDCVGCLSIDRKVLKEEVKDVISDMNFDVTVW